MHGFRNPSKQFGFQKIEKALSIQLANPKPTRVVASTKNREVQDEIHDAASTTRKVSNLLGDRWPAFRQQRVGHAEARGPRPGACSWPGGCYDKISLVERLFD